MKEPFTILKMADQSLDLLSSTRSERAIMSDSICEYVSFDQRNLDLIRTATYWIDARLYLYWKHGGGDVHSLKTVKQFCDVSSKALQN